MSRKILIVEDDELMVKFLKFRLIKDGYTIKIAKDGKIAERLLEEESFSLIITDLMLPFVSGLELIPKIKQIPLNKDTPILILSALNQENVITNGLFLGADDFITKPFAISVLTTKVKLLLNKSNPQPSG